jgi:hypothetical protein
LIFPVFPWLKLSELMVEADLLLEIQRSVKSQADAASINNLSTRSGSVL